MRRAWTNVKKKWTELTEKKALRPRRGFRSEENVDGSNGKKALQPRRWLRREEKVDGAKKYTLKVYIHCYGCEKKVNKILNKMDGVGSVYISGEVSLVTVIGNVELGELINAILKRTGKVAEVVQIDDDVS